VPAPAAVAALAEDRAAGVVGAAGQHRVQLGVRLERQHLEQLDVADHDLVRRQPEGRASRRMGDGAVAGAGKYGLAVHLVVGQPGLRLGADVGYEAVPDRLAGQLGVRAG
jgi:hypothetical protein